jgi:hypothetical protein
LCWARRKQATHEFYEHTDLFVYAIFPCAAYRLLILAGALLRHDPQRSITLVAVVMLVLLALAIRNSWAIVVDLVTRPGSH